MAENQCCVQKGRLLVSPLSMSAKGYRIKERFGIRSLKVQISKLVMNRHVLHTCGHRSRHAISKFLAFSTVSFTVADGFQHNTLPVTTAFSDKLSGKKSETQNFRKFKKQMKR